MRNLVLNLGISLDGFISDNSGGFEWMVGHNDQSQDFGIPFDFEKFLQTVDTVVMGSKAYEDCIISGLETFGDKQIFVATKRQLQKRENVRFISGNIADEIIKLKEMNGKDIYIFGGAILAEYFIKADLIDRYIIGIIPTILGSGRRLFQSDNTRIKLHLDEVSVTDGITVLTYSKR